MERKTANEKLREYIESEMSGWDGFSDPLQYLPPSRHTDLRSWATDLWVFNRKVRRDILAIEWLLAHKMGSITEADFYGDPGDPPPPPEI